MKGETEGGPKMNSEKSKALQEKEPHLSAVEMHSQCIVWFFPILNSLLGSHLGEVNISLEFMLSISRWNEVVE